MSVTPYARDPMPSSGLHLYTYAWMHTHAQINQLNILRITCLGRRLIIHSFSRTYSLHCRSILQKCPPGSSNWATHLGNSSGTPSDTRQDKQQSLNLCQLICGQCFSQMLPGEWQFPDIFQMLFILPAGHTAETTAWRTQPDGPIKGLAWFGLNWIVWALIGGWQPLSLSVLYVFPLSLFPRP